MPQSNYSVQGYVCPFCGTWVYPYNAHWCIGSSCTLTTMSPCENCKVKERCENYKPNCFKERK